MTQRQNGHIFNNLSALGMYFKILGDKFVRTLEPFFKLYWDCVASYGKKSSQKLGIT